MRRFPTVLLASVLASAAGAQGLQLNEVFAVEGQGPDLTLGGGLLSTSSTVTLAVIEDLDGDGTPDLIVGSPSYSRAGRAVVLSGRGGCPIYVLPGHATDDLFGLAVVGLGDLNGDGRADFAIGAPGEDGFGAGGRVYVYSGATGEEMFNWETNRAHSHYGRALARVPDVTNDGVDEILIGASGDLTVANVAGYAELINGKTGGLIRSHTLGTFDSLFGSAVVGIPDLDGDGFGDYAVGAWRYSDPAAGHDTRGLVQVFSGATGVLLAEFEGEADLDAFGYSLDAGDVDGDSFCDIVVGAPFQLGQGQTAPGKVQVLSGEWIATQNPAVDPILLTVNGLQDSSRFGASVAFGGDIDGSPGAELIVGAPNFFVPGSPQSRIGKLFVFDRLGNTLFEKQGELQAGRRDAYAGMVVGGTDLSGDGVPDVVVGDPLHVPSRAFYAGRVSVLASGGSAHRPYPGTGDDLVLRTWLHPLCSGEAGRKNGRVGELVQLQIESPGGTLDLWPVILAVQAFPTGEPPVADNVGAYFEFVPPDVRYSPVVIVIGPGSRVGDLLLPTAGLTLGGFVLPSGLVDRSVMLQAGVFSPLANNGFLALTDGHQIAVRF